jgi:hypothetical protein
MHPGLCCVFANPETSAEQHSEVLGACCVLTGMQAQKVSHNADSTGSQLLKALGAKVFNRLLSAAAGVRDAHAPQAEQQLRLTAAALQIRATPLLTSTQGFAWAVKTDTAGALENVRPAV